MQPIPEDWQRAVAVVAHPDDLEYGVASAIARWTSQGKDVMYVLAKGSSLVAIDVVTHKELWIHANLRGITNRGINYWESRDRPVDEPGQGRDVRARHEWRSGDRRHGAGRRRTAP